MWVVLFWFMTTSSNSKTEKRKIPFLVTKRDQKSYPTFFDERPAYCGLIYVLFLAHDHFIKSKIENHKIPFLVAKRSQKLYRKYFSDPRPPNCEWFHLLFLTHDHFTKPKTEKRKIPFLVTKRNKKLNFTNYLIRDFQILLLLTQIIFDWKVEPSVFMHVSSCCKSWILGNFSLWTI